MISVKNDTEKREGGFASSFSTPNYEERKPNKHVHVADETMSMNTS